MRLCLNCFFLNNPSADKPADKFCPGCGRSYGPTCVKCRTPAPWGSRFCPACGSPELSDPARSLPLPFLPRLVVLALAIFASRWVWQHPWQLLRGTWWTGTAALSVVTASPQHTVQATLTRACGWLIILFLFSFALPREKGKGLRQAMLRALFGAGRLAARLVPLAWRLLVVGRPLERRRKKDD
ncbi:MAG TPA: zinc ribbon domain-containing protein [Chthonomonadaceae bacterium]|nr:zinc ribbon domain-containing protein [Chthonomonadaceae bacterium]